MLIVIAAIPSHWALSLSDQSQEHSSGDVIGFKQWQPQTRVELATNDLPPRVFAKRLTTPAQMRKLVTETAFPNDIEVSH